MSQSQAQPLSPCKLARTPSQNTVVLSNLSYPSRPHSHVSWSRTSRFTKNFDAHSHPTLGLSYASATAAPNDTVTTNENVTTNGHATTNGHVTTTNDHDTEFCLVRHAYHGLRDSIWHELLFFTNKLKLLFQKLINTNEAPLDPSS